MGAFYQIGFATLSAQTFQPLMCYSHPNGSQSLLEFPSTFCGDTEQIIMAVFGVVLGPQPRGGAAKDGSTGKM